MYLWGADLRLAADAAYPYQRVAAATDYADVGVPRSFLFDGFDDSLYTASNMDLSGTDKVTVLAGMCLTLLAEPRKVRWWLEGRAQASRVVPVAFMLLVLVGTAYVHAPMESGGVRTCRALGFTLLAFAWIYLVGIHCQQGIEYLKENSCQFVARLAPVLYAPLWLSAMFVPAAVAALGWHFSLRAKEPALAGEPAPPAPQADPENPPVVSEDAQLHELFRQAKTRLETVPE